jgi:hypothetical protein
MLDGLSPLHRKAELFAVQRTANAVGIILTSTSLTLFSLAVTQAVATGAMLVATAMVAIYFMVRPEQRMPS